MNMYIYVHWWVCTVVTLCLFSGVRTVWSAYVGGVGHVGVVVCGVLDLRRYAQRVL